MEPDYKWIAQDKDGAIWAYELRPEVCMPKNAFYTQWLSKNKKIEMGKENPNWRDSLIDLEEYQYSIIDGILVHGDVKKVRFTDTELIDAIVEHELIVDRMDNGKVIICKVGYEGINVTNKKGDIRKAIKKWLRKNT